MDIQLDRSSRRLIGVLVEKELTTPAHYPLTINALTSGCNQKNNRNPAMSLHDFEVEGALKALYLRQWVTNASQAGSRVLKWKHRAQERMGIDAEELAVMAELLLRGAQQPGELRARANRMQPIDGVAALEALLNGLETKGLVRRLEQRPGERARRVDHTLYAEEEQLDAGATMVMTVDESSLEGFDDEEDVSILRVRVKQLETRVANLESKLAEFLGPGFDGSESASTSA